jgi:oligopeptide/dipeptide ABC transporter ATP-binding protein
MTDAVVCDGISKRFRLKSARSGAHSLVAVDEVSFSVAPGASFGLVGESGSGKSTVARCLVGLLVPDSGNVIVLGKPVTGVPAASLAARRSEFQIVFQEPYESLDPRIRIGKAIAEPLVLHSGLRGPPLDARVLELMAEVGLDGSLVDRLPHQLSGGQQQRVNIARALATRPKVVVLDEPTSSLDVSVRADVLGLLARLQVEHGLTYVIISHDLRTMRAMCDEVAVMYRGRIVEHGPAEAVLSSPHHPYTRLLLAAELSLVPGQRPERGAPTALDMLADRGGCLFRPRCPLRTARCDERPPLSEIEPGHLVACVEAGPSGEGDLAGQHRSSTGGSP